MVRGNTLSESYNCRITTGTGTGVRSDGTAWPATLSHHRSPIMLMLMGVLRRYHTTVT